MSAADGHNGNPLRREIAVESASQRLYGYPIAGPFYNHDRSLGWQAGDHRLRLPVMRGHPLDRSLAAGVYTPWAAAFISSMARSKSGTRPSSTRASSCVKTIGSLRQVVFPHGG